MIPLHEPPLDVLLNFADIPATVEAHFEEHMMDVDEVLAILPASVISLNRAAGETLSVYVGNVPLASAEVILLEDHLTLRITQFGTFDS